MRSWHYDGKKVLTGFDGERLHVLVVQPGYRVRRRTCLTIHSVVNLLAMDEIHNWPDTLLGDLKRDIREGRTPERDYGDLTRRSA